MARPLRRRSFPISNTLEPLDSLKNLSSFDIQLFGR